MKALLFIAGLLLATVSTSVVRADDKDDLLKLLELQTEGLPPSFSLIRLDFDLNRIAKAVYVGKAPIVTEAAAQITKTDLTDSWDRLFVMNAILPVIQGIHSEYFDRSVIPAYNRAIADENNRRGVRSLADLKNAPKRKSITLALIRRGLETLNGYFGEARDQRSIGAMKTAVGMAMASGSEADLSQCVAVLADHEDIFLRATTAPRTEGVGMMLSSLTEALR